MPSILYCSKYAIFINVSSFTSSVITFFQTAVKYKISYTFHISIGRFTLMLFLHMSILLSNLWHISLLKNELFARARTSYLSLPRDDTFLHWQMNPRPIFTLSFLSRIKTFERPDGGSNLSRKWRHKSEHRVYWWRKINEDDKYRILSCCMMIKCRRIGLYIQIYYIIYRIPQHIQNEQYEIYLSNLSIT